MSPQASVCLNIAEDHVDLFGSFEAYVAAKARIYERTQVAAVYNVADEVTRRMVEDADVVEGCRAIGFTLGIPDISMLGVVEEFLVDRAFVPDRRGPPRSWPPPLMCDRRPRTTWPTPWQRPRWPGPTASPRAAVRDGLRAFEPAGHRIADVGTVAGVRYVDDSKATNCHAAQTSLMAYDRVVWIAGGLAKGQQFDDLVRATASRMTGVVLLGADRGVIADAIARHAPDLPMVEVSRTDTGAMAEVVAAAAAMAGPGGTVLLAPGCASWDMFRDYAQRGDMFAEAVKSLAQEGT